MKKYDFSNITFIIPIRIDSTIRLENLLITIGLLNRWRANILIVHADRYDNHFITKLVPKKQNIKYVFYEDRDYVFFRTHYINVSIIECKTPYVAVWDADVIVSPQQIQESQKALMHERFDVSYPYNGEFLNVDKILREEFIQSQNIKSLHAYKDYMKPLYGGIVYGGGFIISRDKYIASGGENEKFYGWGSEDSERYKRWSILEYKIHRSAGPMFHLYHPRDLNGKFRSELQFRLCNYFLSMTANSSKREILKDNEKEDL